ncbi:MAG TPA: NAD(P)-dependent oxidoreductase [Rhizomicrobium sp.]|jgi:phosphoglycerate dehydrogenase-like enzyme
MTDLERLPRTAKEFVERTLHQLAFENRDVAVQFVPSPASGATPEFFRDCNAVIIRPTDNISTSTELFQHCARPLHIYSVSAGSDHLSQFSDTALYYRQHCEGISNERGVAAFNFLLAKTLLARLPANINNVRLGRFRAMPDQTNLVGKTWLLLGSGKQVKHMLNFGFFTGIKKFIVHNERIDECKFRGCLEKLKWTAGRSLVVSKEQLSAKIEIEGPVDGVKQTVMEIVGERDWRKHGGEIDIVSIHVPLSTAKGNVHDSNAGFVNEKWLSNLTNKPVLINTGRGPLLNEGAVLDALRDGRLSGVAVDVLDAKVEKKSQSSESALWTEYARSGSKVKNLLVTPHIAGSADGDVLPMWKMMLGKLATAISEGGPR